jgi:hypothetical protein
MSFGGNIGHFHPGFIYIYMYIYIETSESNSNIEGFFFFFFFNWGFQGKGLAKGTRNARYSVVYFILFNDLFFLRCTVLLNII